MTHDDKQYGIIPPPAHYGATWDKYLNLPRGSGGLISSAGSDKSGTADFGVPQQTFLGASIRSFTLNAGFGTNASTLSVQLIEDQYNKSDRTGLGLGDDVYHNGKFDKFRPPPPGSPVFFKFGNRYRSIEKTWEPIFDYYVGKSSLKNTHLVFGGLLQSFTENRGRDGNPLYSAQIIDPREILSNTVLILKNYSGKIYNNFNYINIYGFLEYEPSQALKQEFLENSVPGYIVNGPELVTLWRKPDQDKIYKLDGSVVTKQNNYLSKIVDENTGQVYFWGTDVYRFNKEYIEKDVDLVDIAKEEEKRSKIKKDTTETIEESKPSTTIEYIEVDSILPPEEATKIATEYLNNLLSKAKDLLSKDTDLDPAAAFFLVSADTDAYPEPNIDATKLEPLSEFFPITGVGMSRVSDLGMPFYRIRQAILALLQTSPFGRLPEEYIKAGFFRAINFRGFNYVIDFSSIPFNDIPPMYNINYESIDLLAFFQEICELTNSELSVELLPVINYPDKKNPLYYNIYLRNLRKIKKNEDLKDLITGIIRINFIKKDKFPKPGQIANYITTNGKQITNRDTGYELTNITTDRMVVGAQEVEMYYFNTNKDRDHLELRRKNNSTEDEAFPFPNNYEFLLQEQWFLETSLQQQMLPFYGFLGEGVVTIPRGFGSYQQILLDSSSLDAYGVGPYYIATEKELRAASVSYEQWAKFLLQYNDIYMEEVDDNYQVFNSLASSIPSGTKLTEEQEKLFSKDLEGREYAVTVPRSVFVTENQESYDFDLSLAVNSDGLPKSSCAPPYGYPLYYKRAYRIGIPEAGIAKFIQSYNELVTDLNESVKDSKKRDQYLKRQKELQVELEKYKEKAKKNKKFQEYVKQLEYFIQNVDKEYKKAIDSGIKIEKIKNTLKSSEKFIRIMNRLSRLHLANARKVYDFLKKIADECLGKKFLIKIPSVCNTNYSNNIEYIKYNDTKKTNTIKDINIGPFGFQPRDFFVSSGNINNPFNLGSGYYVQEFADALIQSQERHFDPFETYCRESLIEPWEFFNPLFYDDPYVYKNGALKFNFNPIKDTFEFNYLPAPEGGFFNYAIFDRNLSQQPNIIGAGLTSKVNENGAIDKNLQIKSRILPPATRYALAPKDLTNFVNQNGRISCYVRYDNSEYLNLSSIPANSRTQQFVDENTNQWISDIMEDIGNTLSDQDKIFFDYIKDKEGVGLNRKKSVVYIKCELDDKFYFTPPLDVKQIYPYGQLAEQVHTYREPLIVEIEDESGCKKMVPGIPPYQPIFKIPSNGGIGDEKITLYEFKTYYNKDADSHLIDTRKENANPLCVYALITLPDKVIPTIDARYIDGPQQSLNGSIIKHLLTLDVIKNSNPKRGLVDPPPIDLKDDLKINCDEFTLKQLNRAINAKETALEFANFVNPEKYIDFKAPSPVYPDLVALPLMSKERCYGPWFSNSIVNNLSGKKTYKNLGGKVEFLKHENLAPWNYAGYQLMNQAGVLEAQFANSLLLFTERGGFKYGGIPTGVVLAKYLKDDLGPLVTSISVNIGDRDINTTVQMDLYTHKFGKLQKFAEEQVGKITRERQKIIDQNNKSIRTGTALGTRKTNIVQEANKLGGNQLYTGFELNHTVQTNIVGYAGSKEESINTDNGEVNTNYHYNEVGIQDSRYFADIAGIIDDDNKWREMWNKHYGGNLSDIFTGYDERNDSPYLPSNPYLNINAINNRIF